LLIHARAIGNSALMVVDRRRGRAVRVNVLTGVLPKDKELAHLRGCVINHKRVASGREHRRFFDRLGELIVDYVRTGDGNFELHGPVPLDWDEYRTALAFSPPNRRSFAKYLVEQRVSASVGQALVGLGVLDARRDAEELDALSTGAATGPDGSAAFEHERLYAGSLSERVTRVVETIIAPVLANDGGRLDVLEIDDATGELRIRFVGSCANCPYSLLSMEQIVKPTLLAVPGVTRVSHRAKARAKELPVAVSFS
jgi:Fe-S cluster biogenesis protein NfuA